MLAWKDQLPPHDHSPAAQPRKGAFEVKVGDTTIESLTVRGPPAGLGAFLCNHTEAVCGACTSSWWPQNLARPFTKLRELDIDEVAAKVVKAL